ncbi:hypothetical protein B0H14DRAFT_2652234 [Mycena olivaceomarginata]|nr:hypothetical protein B0H14DRAFT_2652234 [Mycena olivaceomarginata]
MEKDGERVQTETAHVNEGLDLVSGDASDKPCNGVGAVVGVDKLRRLDAVANTPRIGGNDLGLWDLIPLAQLVGRVIAAESMGGQPVDDTCEMFVERDEGAVGGASRPPAVDHCGLPPHWVAGGAAWVALIGVEATVAASCWRGTVEAGTASDTVGAFKILWVAANFAEVGAAMGFAGAAAAFVGGAVTAFVTGGSSLCSGSGSLCMHRVKGRHDSGRDWDRGGATSCLGATTGVIAKVAVAVAGVGVAASTTVTCAGTSATTVTGADSGWAVTDSETVGRGDVASSATEVTAAETAGPEVGTLDARLAVQVMWLLVTVVRSAYQPIQ